ncbi:long-chain acyl-CoA synthetase [Polaromonas sp. YR568]|uniref:AMP-dependent synthetase/ligase n=1 Tax=Polaromonas sp. YR568 TaxID=1855301 RepID=UPI0008F23567|nr:AMP-binding protein [Polaromonas sp. YR568]SFU94704.1 long-chain acyl-CoA synthetase [Polaromonas sp. YR568]
MATEGPDTFPKLLLHHSRQRGGQAAIREKNRGIWHTWTWAALAGEVAALAGALSARGVQRGSYVALIGDNRPRLYAAMCAAQWLGAVAVPLYQDAAAGEILSPLQRAGVTHVFAENQEQVDKLLDILPQCPAIQCIVYDEDRGLRHYRQPQLVSYAALLAQGRELAATNSDALQAEMQRGSGEDVAFLFFTSGTTGPSKGVVLSHAALIDRARAAAAAEGLNDKDVATAYLPPGWIGQNLFSYVQPMVVGYCVCCPESSDTMLADMREAGPTYLLVPPRVLEVLLSQISMRIEDTGGFNQTLYRRAMALARRVGPRILAGEDVSLADRIAYKVFDLLIYGPLRDVLGMSRVRVALTAGDAIDPELLMFFRSLGINLKQLYGSTETGFFVAMQRDGQVRPGTVGTAVDGVELKITDRREILVRSPGLFREYHGDPHTTAKARSEDGWFHTGDAGYLGDDGHLRIIDRLMSVGALNDGSLHAPKLLENRLKFGPSIREAVAYGDGRDMVCILVDIDAASVGRWADKQSISYMGQADLASREEVYGLVADRIAELNAELAADPALATSQIHRFAILHKALDADDGVLTRTGKLRRGIIAERYAVVVDGMYAGRASVQLEDGTELKIRDAKTFAPAPARKAA